ncbi:MAG: hypothetical protein NVSMB64_18580 [Candidatus Velthaea sp.]
MNRLEEEREAANKIVRPREAEEAKAREANRGIVADAYASIHEREQKQRTQRLTDFNKGDYGSLEELVAAATLLA